MFKEKRVKIKHIYIDKPVGKKIVVMGWVRTFRNNQFIALNDGSTNQNFQIVIDFEKTDEAILKKINTGACLCLEGEIINSIGKGQSVEMKADKIEILGESDAETYPLQPKKHSLEFLREIAHLRFRTNTFSSIFRIRHALAFAAHKFFNDREFIYLHTPIITASDCEGAGEMFQVSTLDLKQIPKTPEGEVAFEKDFFGKRTGLTVSGQLEGELGAMALAEVYTFGPTFRAENSNTARHLAEFWMIEPEMAFYDIEDNMKLAEDLLKYLINYVLENCLDDLQFLESRLIEEEKQKPQLERSELSLLEKLKFCLNNDFEKITYTEAIDILLNSKQYKNKKFQYDVKWGIDLQSEHERYLVEKHFKKPVVLYNYPKEIKAFYMRQNEDEKTVAAMDVLFPGIGEIVGGSQREERLKRLEKRMKEMNLPIDEMYWYLDTRRFGTCVHSGFGLGFERLVLFITGMTNIRDVIPFARTPKNAEF